MEMVYMYLSDNAAVDWMKAAAQSYVDTMTQLVVNTFAELYPANSSARAMTSRDMRVLFTAVCSLFGLLISLGAIYTVFRILYWIVVDQSTNNLHNLRQPSGNFRDDGSCVEVRRWFSQARNDLMAAANDLECAYPAPEWVCFKCQQAVEKGLKALLISKQNTLQSPITTHDICELASFTDNPRLVTMATKLQGIVGMTPRMRYPDFLPSPKTPRDVYTSEMALNAYSVAGESLQIIREAVKQLL